MKFSAMSGPKVQVSSSSDEDVFCIIYGTVVLNKVVASKVAAVLVGASGERTT